MAKHSRGRKVSLHYKLVKGSKEAKHYMAYLQAVKALKKTKKGTEGWRRAFMKVVAATIQTSK